MEETLRTLHTDLVFCPTVGHGVPVRLIAWPGGPGPGDETRLVCHGFTAGVCRGRCALTGDPAPVMEARAVVDGADGGLVGDVDASTPPP